MQERSRHLETALVITTGMLVLYFVWGVVAFLWVALGVATVGAFVPVLAQSLHMGWTLFGKALAWVNSFLILGLMFYVVLTPMALLRRLLAKDVLQRRRSKGESYFHTREHTYGSKDLENLW